MAMKQINVVEFWSRFDNARQDTLEDISKGAGVSQGTIRNLRSRKMLPNLYDAAALANYLNVSLDWLVFGKVNGALPYSEYLSYIEALDKYDPEKLRVVREILGMASLKTEPERKIFFGSTKEVN